MHEKLTLGISSQSITHLPQTNDHSKLEVCYEYFSCNAKT